MLASVRRFVLLILLLLIGAASTFIGAPSLLARMGGDVTLVSVSSAGTQGNEGSSLPALSPNGRFVAFRSSADNLVGGDSNLAQDVFIHDRTTGETSRISVASDGTQGNSTSDDPALSFDGRFVAFNSYANNFVSGDNNRNYDIFVHDRETGQTTRVSQSSNGIGGNNESWAPVLSANGRFVAFYSYATNLVSGDSNQAYDVFVHDRTTSRTVRVSVSADGEESCCSSYDPALSASGRLVAFESWGSNLVPDDTNLASDIFVRDLITGQIERVSVASDGTQSNGESYSATLSGRGQWVAFRSVATNLVPDDSNGRGDIFLHDRQSRQTMRVSVAFDGTEANGESHTPVLSADGRWVAFYSLASNLVPNDTNEAADVFVYDRSTGTITRLSVATDGTEGNAPSQHPALSANGQVLAFDSWASNLVLGDMNNVMDVFTYQSLP